MARADASLLGLRCEVFDHIATPPIARTKPRFPTDSFASPTNVADDLGLPSYAKLDVLVAYLTSRDVVRSEAMRDYFMTFRLFASAQEVWDLLCARLLWAARQAARTGGESELGNDVGTRSFVMLRYWIREYFRDDFHSDELLRAHAAHILTALSGVTEFVLSEHFRRIHAQLRRAWVDQVARYWPVPADISANDDAPIPPGGSVAASKHQGDDKGPAHARVLIDADIGVPMIKSSPVRTRPRPKLSVFFGRKRDKSTNKNSEVVLHNKVDLLALRVIDEFRGISERQAQALAKTKEHRDTHTSIPSMLVPDLSDITESTIDSQLASSLHPTDSTMSGSPEQLHELGARPASASSSFMPTGTVPPIAPPSRPRTPRAESDEASGAADHESPEQTPGEQTPRDKTPGAQTPQEQTPYAQTPEEQTPRAQPRPERAYAENLSQEEVSQEELPPEQRPQEQPFLDEAATEQMPEEGQAYHSYPEKEAPQLLSFHSTSTRSTSEYRTPTPSLIGNETWSTPMHSPTSYDDSASIPHEKSMDTLDMDHMVLANTSGESEIDEDDDEGRFAMEPVSWGPVDMNDFERVSYSGSSLSTLSIARESTYSYHGERTSVPTHSEEASWSRTRQSMVYTGSPRSSLRSTLSGDGDPFSGYDDDSQSVSLLSEQDNSLLQPCAGYTPEDAAQLKAIPDDDVEGDILGATLQMLEGTYVRGASLEKAAKAAPLSQHTNEHTVSTDQLRDAADADAPGGADDSLDMGYTRGIPRSNTAELYAQAFGSTRSVGALASDVDELGIPAPHGVDAILANVREEEGVQSHFMSPSVPATRRQTLVQQPQKPSFSQLSLHIGAPGATHAPFILSYTARAVAEQMTLIERDVLQQLEWRELVEGRWPTAEACPESWLRVLERSPPLRGVGLVTARFELVCAWVRSEILLCESPALQAQAYSRFVHIAFEALRLQNFATMIQLILGLTSETVRMRMSDATMKLLSDTDRDTLERMEALASPSRNYAAIRETHHRLSRARGCIPFTPMFLADLAANAVVTATNAEHEIHFGKYRTTAQLAQNLLNCAARSQKYTIEPQQALFSKCLYLSKLTPAEELHLSNI